VLGEGKGSIKNIENIKAILLPVTQLAPIEQDPESYRDYGNDVKFSAKTARGECAA
jgi:sulfite reductase (ferredoxin)